MRNIAVLWLNCGWNPSKLRVRPAPKIAFKERYIQQDLRSPDVSIRVGLPWLFSLTISDQKYRPNRVRSDVAKFCEGQTRAEICNLCGIRDVENPSDKIPPFAPIIRVATPSQICIRGKLR